MSKGLDPWILALAAVMSLLLLRYAKGTLPLLRIVSQSKPQSHVVLPRFPLNCIIVWRCQIMSHNLI